MRNSTVLTFASIALLFSAAASGQNLPPRGTVDQRPPSVADKLQNAGPGGPAPAKDLNGSWAGPLEPKLGTAPTLTALGQKLLSMARPDPFSADTNDPWTTCDPYGMPRST